MILINVKTEKYDQNYTCKTDKEANKFLQDLANSIRKHSYYKAEKELEACEYRKKRWMANYMGSGKTAKQQAIMAQHDADIKAATEALAMIDPPGKIVVKITKHK